MKNFRITLAILIPLLLFSCATTKKSGVEDFYEQKVGKFVEFSLSNGIPVVLKNIPAEKNIEFRLLFEGGASVCPRNKSGLDSLTFELVSSNAAIDELVSKGKYFSSNSCANDYSSCGFSCSAADFGDTLLVFAKSILDFEYDHQDYLRLESAAAAAAFDRSENIRFALLNAVNENLYKAHPYYEGVFYKTSSRVSEYDIEENLRSLLNAKRIKIIAAGNFSYKNEKKERRTEPELFAARAAQLKDTLEELFGKIPESSFAAPKIPAINLANKKDAKINFEFARNSYCAAMCFNCPTRGSSDYAAFALSTLALDYILRRDVVEKEKAALSCGTAILNGKESVALIITNGSNEDRDIKQIISAALDSFPTEDGLAPLLDTFRNIYASKVYSSAQDEYATLDQITSSIFYEGSPNAYLKRIEKIQATTAAEVVAAFKKYFLSDEKFFVELHR